VWQGILALPPVEYIAVHDVARPLAPERLLLDAVTILETSGHAGAIPAVPVSDTIKAVDGQAVVCQTLDRTVLRAVQTPQVFRAENLTRAHRESRRFGWSTTDDAMLLEARGDSVATFPGAPENLKITTAIDLEVAALLLERQDVT
jgi:2-C-methyl-D-erythritol 4-phosphate cytidylyltransferase